IYCDIPPTAAAGAQPLQLDVQLAGSLSSRVRNTSSYGSGQGGVDLNHRVVVELTYTGAPGVGLRSKYRHGCYRGAASFYEMFARGTFYVSNTPFQMINNGLGYAVTSAPTTNWFTPGTQTLPLADESVSGPQTLPFTFPYPGGSTNSIYVASNGI